MLNTIIHTYTHTHTQIHIHTHIHTNTHTHIHTYTHTYIKIHTHIHIYIHTHIHTNTHTHKSTETNTTNVFTLYSDCTYIYAQGVHTKNATGGARGEVRTVWVERLHRDHVAEIGTHGGGIVKASDRRP